VGGWKTEWEAPLVLGCQTQNASPVPLGRGGREAAAEGRRVEAPRDQWVVAGWSRCGAVGAGVDKVQGLPKGAKLSGEVAQDVANEKAGRDPPPSCFTDELVP
jgi:hypothetical protein